MLRDLIFVDRANIRREQSSIKNIRSNRLSFLTALFHELRADGASPFICLAARSNIRQELSLITNHQGNKTVFKNRIRGLQDWVERLHDLEF